MCFVCKLRQTTDNPTEAIHKMSDSYNTLQHSETKVNYGHGQIQCPVVPVHYADLFSARQVRDSV